MAIKERVDDIEWTTQDEIQLFHGLDGLQFTGLCKHFSMAVLVDRLNGQFKLSHQITSDALWAKIRTLYNLEKLDELHHSSTIDVEDFSLPEHLIIKSSKSSEEESEPKVVDVKPESQKSSSTGRDEKRNSTPLRETEVKRTLPKRTRGSTSAETSSSPSTPTQNPPKRRRI